MASPRKIKPEHLKPDQEELETVQRHVTRNKESRVVRVFVSSTFRDCQAERNILQHLAVPLINQWCAGLRPEPLGFNCLDLRWGVTDEQVQEGDVVGICLDEIDRCRPFFIGIMTERYGWHNATKLAGGGDEVNSGNELLIKCIERAAERFPWIKSYDERSVTELEIWHGALRHIESMKSRAFFYYRAADFFAKDQESKKPEDKESELAAARLRQLKQEIKEAGFTVRDYSSIAEFNDLVQEDMKTMIQDEFPMSQVQEEDEFGFGKMGQPISVLEQERLLQESLCRVRVRNFVRSGAAADLLEKYISSPKGEEVYQPPVVVFADSGLGKSTLLAYVAHLARDNGHTACIQFCGCGSGLVSKDDVLASLLHQATHYGVVLPNEKFDSPSSRAAAFYQMLSGNFEFSNQGDRQFAGESDQATHEEGGTGSGTDPYLVVVIDALERMEGDGPRRKLALSFSWLPKHISTKVRLVVSTANPDILEKFKSDFEWRHCDILPMDKEASGNLIKGVLREQGKCLAETRLQMITNATQTSNPLYTSILLKELCVCAVHEDLDTHLTNYLKAQNGRELFLMILKRWEDRYGSKTATSDDNPGQNLVEDVFISLYISNRGMTEGELQQAWGLTSVALSSLLSAAGDSLVTSSSGVLVISHSDLIAACLFRYLVDPVTGRWNHNEERVRKRLADFFTQNKVTPLRQAEELPYHLLKLRARNRLLSYASELETLDTHNDPSRKFNLMRFWRYAGGYTIAGSAYPCELRKKYGKKKGTDAKSPLLPTAVGRELPLCPFQSGSLLVDFQGDDEREAEFALDLEMVALFLWETGQYGAAMPLFKQHLDIMVKYGGDCHPLSVKALLQTAECQFKVGEGQGVEGLQVAIAYCQRALVGAESCSAHEMFSGEGEDMKGRILHRLGHIYACVGKCLGEGPQKVSSQS